MRSALVLPAIQPFNNGQWRSMINKICKELDKTKIGIEAISPFGFELLEDKRFLTKNLKRFYCYIGIPSKAKFSQQECYKLLQNFSEELFDSISINFPALIESFILKIHQDKFIKLRPEHYKPKEIDKLLDIQVRYINNSILDDYADYIIATLAALNNEKDEVKFFMHNTRFRSRTFQLYIMQECLFNNFLPPMTEKENNLYRLIFSKIRNSVDIFYDDTKLNISASHEEQEIMYILVKPRIELMMEIVKAHSDTFILKIESYHVADNLELKIGKQFYDQLKENIKNSYVRFE